MRIYTIARSVHLERLKDFSTGHLYFLKKSYDFHAAPNGANWTQCSSVFSLLIKVFSARGETIEINEPLSISSWPVTVAIVSVNRFLRLVSPKPNRIVSYAIENMDVSLALASKLRIPRRLSRALVRLFAGYIHGGLHRVAFGTLGASENYGALLSPRVLSIPESELFLALPNPCECAKTTRVSSSRKFVFLGSLERRKGFRLLCEAWTKNAISGRDAGCLTVLGKGVMQPIALQLASKWPSQVAVEIDPARSRIHATLRDSDIMVLMSQAEPRWREQVGLPILEALAHGLHVVTTDESGLAPWLRANGHTVLRSSCDADELAETLVALSTTPVSPATILGSLPQLDQRVAADEWLCA
ncbi:glycosyltransferase family 4 protein [Pseudarthrobacter defluvii]